MTEQLEDDGPTNEEILAELNKHKEYGILDYVLPTIPLGESWVVGVRGQIVKLGTKGEVVAFLVGVSATVQWVGARIPGVLT